jgi:hypothetical protein
MDGAFSGVSDQRPYLCSHGNPDMMEIRVSDDQCIMEVLSGTERNRTRTQKPAVTYDIVSYYYRKAVCPNLFAALPNVFLII